MAFLDQIDLDLDHVTMMYIFFTLSRVYQVAKKNYYLAENKFFISIVKNILNFNH